MKFKKIKMCKFTRLTGFIIVLLAFSSISVNAQIYNLSNPNVPQSFSNSFQNINDSDANYSQYLDESDVYYKKGMEYYRANEYTKAIESLEKALDLAPDRSTTRINLAVTYLNRGTYYFNKESNLGKAASDYRKAIYYLKYDEYELSTKLAKENLHIAEENFKNVLTELGTEKDKEIRLRTAKALRGQGKFKEAIVEFNEAIKRRDSNFEILEALGDLYKALQKTKLAEHYYQKALAIDQKSPSLHLKYAKALQDNGNNDVAVKEFNIALTTSKEEQKGEILVALENIWIEKIQKNPRDSSAHMNLGVVLQKKGNLDGALREYKIAESIDPNDITTRLNLGTLFQAKKKYKTAIRAYDTILQVKPDHLLAHYYRGSALRDMGRLHDAINEFQFILNKDNKHIQAKEALFETVKLFPNPNDTINILSAFARNNPRDAVAQFKYAFYLHSINRFDEAMEYYHRTVKADRKYTDAYLNIASIYKQKNQIPLAVSVLEKALKDLPNNKKIKEMITLIKSEVATVRYHYALQMHTKGKYEEAINEYKNIIAISEPDSDLYVNLGAAYQALKQNDEAIKVYKESIKINDSNSTAYYYLGTAYFEQEDFDKALKSYQKALAIDPGNKNIQQAIDSSRRVMTDKILEKGILEYNQGKYKEALLTLNTALITEPENPEVYYQRGMVYDTLEKYPLAISDYKHAIRFNPMLTLAYYSLAVNYDILKNYPEAKKYYEEFIKKSDNNDDEYVKYAKDRISQL